MSQITDILYKQERPTISECSEICKFIQNNVSNGNEKIIQDVLQGPIEKYNILSLKCLVRYTVMCHDKIPYRPVFVKRVLKLFKSNKMDCKIHFKGLNSELL